MIGLFVLPVTRGPFYFRRIVLDLVHKLTIELNDCNHGNHSHSDQDQDTYIVPFSIFFYQPLRQSAYHIE